MTTHSKVVMLVDKINNTAMRGMAKIVDPKCSQKAYYALKGS